ncbi:MAG: VCBS repeat-containing protein, partial [Anaerolineales bacterium]|nr:VCBS repeat-containing protein [Anaerolineales bacterium]
MLFILGISAIQLATRVTATEVPFGAEILVNGSFDGAYSIAVADLDQDGDFDLLSAGYNENEIVWWENISENGFTWSSSNVLTNTLPGAVDALATDLNGDGAPDVVGISATTGDVLWWNNLNGNASAWETTLIDSFLDEATGLFVADVNGDGAQDVIVVGTVPSSESVLWYENSGDGTSWTRRTVGVGLTTPQAALAADLDRDGDMDLAVGSQDANEISWWRNENGVGTTWTPLAVSGNYAAANGLAVADMDKDGDPDLVGAFASENTVAWFENNGTGKGWVDHPITSTFAGATAVEAIDMDGDGDNDIVGAGQTADQILWWDNTAGNASLWQEYTVSPSFDGARAIAVLDLDRNGLVDVVGAADEADSVVWWKNTAVHRNAYFPLDAAIVVDGNMSGAFSVAGADFDRDGKQDLLAGASNTNEVAWYRNNLGNGTNWTKNSFGNLSGVRSLFVADLNGDGSPDVLGAGTVSNDVVWWANDGAGNFGGANSIDITFLGAFWVAAGDVDGDGDQDVLGAAFSGGFISWWENLDGEGDFGPRNTIATGYSGATSILGADLDRDGDLDVVGSAYSNDTISWWENTAGNGTTWAEQPIDTAIDGPVSTFAADMDGDGDLDVLGASNLAQEFSWWENTDGLGTFNEDQTLIGSNFANAESVYGADLDLDGDTDVVGAAQNDNTVVWFENTEGDGLFWSEHLVSDTVPEAVAVHVMDVDRDGRPDILSAANTGNLVHWWGNRGGQFALPTVDTSPQAISEGQTVSIMTLTFTHNGRNADANIELSSLAFFFEEEPGNVMGESEANALIENLHVYLDNGSGVFEEDQDTLAWTVIDLDLVSGFSTITLPGNEIEFTLEYGESKTYFIVLDMTDDAADQDPNTIVITHLTNAPGQSSTATDVDSQIPLLMAYAPDVASSLLTFAPELFIEKRAEAAPAEATLGEATLADPLPQAGIISIVEPGETILYTLIYSNTTGTPATQFSITDLMPVETQFTDFTFT